MQEGSAVAGRAPGCRCLHLRAQKTGERPLSWFLGLLFRLFGGRSYVFSLVFIYPSVNRITFFFGKFLALSQLDVLVLFSCIFGFRCTSDVIFIGRTSPVTGRVFIATVFALRVLRLVPLVWAVFDRVLL